MGIEQDYAIEVNNVSKVYKLYDKNSDRFKDALGFGRKKKLYREHYALMMSASRWGQASALVLSERMAQVSRPCSR